MNMPNLYSCDLCGGSIDPKGMTTIRFVSGWVKGQSRSLASIEQEHWRYRHDFCVDKAVRDQQETLF